MLSWKRGSKSTRALQLSITEMIGKIHLCSWLKSGAAYQHYFSASSAAHMHWTGMLPGGPGRTQSNGGSSPEDWWCPADQENKSIHFCQYIIFKTVLSTPCMCKPLSAPDTKAFPNYWLNLAPSIPRRRDPSDAQDGGALEVRREVRFISVYCHGYP